MVQQTCWCGKSIDSYCSICIKPFCRPHKVSDFRRAFRKYDEYSLESYVLIRAAQDFKSEEYQRLSEVCPGCATKEIERIVRKARTARDNWPKDPLMRYTTAQAQEYAYENLIMSMTDVKLAFLLDRWVKEANRVGVKMVSTRRHTRVMKPQQVPRKRKLFSAPPPPPPAKFENRYEEVKAWRFETISIGEAEGAGPAGHGVYGPVYDTTFFLPSGELLYKDGGLFRIFTDKDAFTLVTHMATLIIEARGPRYKW